MATERLEDDLPEGETVELEDVDNEVEDTEDISAGDTVTVLISLEREVEDQQGVPAVHAPHYPKAR